MDLGIFLRVFSIFLDTFLTKYPPDVFCFFENTGLTFEFKIQYFGLFEHILSTQMLAVVVPSADQFSQTYSLIEMMTMEEKKTGTCCKL